MLKVTGYLNGTALEESIDDTRIRGAKGKVQCPVCPTLGKKNIKDTCLSVNLDAKVFKCHKCDWRGGWGESIKTEYDMKPKYERPNIGNQTDLIDAHLQAFSKRLITQKVLIRNKVKSAKNNFFAFTYFDGEDPVKVKYKTPKDKEGNKKLYQHKDCKPWIYKYNDLVAQDEVMICEGEEEALIWEVAGFKHACSVDMGAPNENDSNAEGKLQCITNCFDVFEDASLVYVAVDNDTNGHILQKELIRRIGAEKCKIINFGTSKDANDYALHNDTKSLLELIKTARDVQVEGIFKAEQFYDSILNNYLEGQPRGETTHFKDIDPKWTWRMGEVNVWSGYNNEGKSMLLKQLQICKSLGEGWRHAIFSPEEWPLDEWYTDLIESYVGKSADKTKAQFNNYMTKEELDGGFNFVNDYFLNVYPPEDHSIDELLKKFSYTVRKYDCKTITFDPYNQVHHQMLPGEREDLYISKFMSKLKRFAIQHMVSVNLVAHQSTPQVVNGENYPMPNLFKIKGGGTFGDKSDNVLAVWREYRNTDITCTKVKFISQKIKKQKLTGIPGDATIDFDRNSNRYLDTLGNSPIQKLKDQIAAVLAEQFTIPEFEEAIKPTLLDNLNAFENETAPF